MKIYLISVIFFSSLLTNAYIPPLPFIVEKSIATTGKDIVSLDQEVVFQVLDEQATIKENWLIEGDKNLKVSSFGTAAYKQNISFHALYNGKARTIYIGKNRQTSPQTSDFYQKYLFIRSPASFNAYLNDLLIPAEIRLSRVDGRVGFAIGKVTQTQLNPQIWIDQEEFFIRKIRLPSETEIVLSDFYEVKPGFMVARNQKIFWGGLTVTVKVLKITIKPKESLNSFYPQYLDTPSEITFATNTPMAQAITNFYQRFR